EELEAFRLKALVELGESSFKSHDVDGAQKRLEDALALARKRAATPELARIYAALGDVFVRRNELGGARSFYMRALQEAPDEAAKRRALGRRGRLAMRKGRWSEAASRFEEAVQLDPSPAAWRELGEARLRAGRGQAATDAFDEA